MISTVTFFLFLASLRFGLSAKLTQNLETDSQDTPGTFSVPFTYTLGADAKYVATIAVGSQGTEMELVMDMGSALSWMYGPNDISWGNSSINGPFNCNIEWTPFYSFNASTTGTRTPLTAWSANYGDNAKIIQGSTQAIDTLSSDPSCPGPRLPFCVANTAVVRQHDTSACEAPPFDYGGIFGLAGSTNSPGLYNASFRYNVQHPPSPQLPLIESATISLFLRNATTTPALQLIAGEVLLGGIDTSAFVGPLVSIANATHDPTEGYFLPLPILSVAGVNVTLDPAFTEPNGGCLIDSGTVGDIWPVNLVPDYLYDPSIFDAQTGLVNLTFPNGTIAFGYPSACADIPANATFDFAWSSPSGKDVTIKVPIRNYARNSDEVNDQTCVLQLDTVGCVLGASFLSGTYFVADDDTGVVALAQAGEGTGGRVAIKKGEGIPGLVL